MYFLCVHTHVQTHIHKDTQKERQTGRDREMERDREIHGEAGSLEERWKPLTQQLLSNK